MNSDLHFNPLPTFPSDAERRKGRSKSVGALGLANASVNARLSPPLSSATRRGRLGGGASADLSSNARELANPESRISNPGVQP